MEAIPPKTIPNFHLINPHYPTTYQKITTIPPNLNNPYPPKPLKIPPQNLFHHLNTTLRLS
ncbi:hypothetical protein, partial [Virgibacillus sp. SK37]|uniref:hypothetical protein n=1 Tax=Virgibacillus sp. SK37 TaxID=403957 RepID=UPI001B311BA8